MNKIPAKYTPIVFGFWMAFFMSLLMSGMITSLNTGFGDMGGVGFISRWARAWVIAFPVAFLVAVGSRPIVMKMVSLCVAKPT